MTDLSRLIDDICAGLDGQGTSEFPVLPETLSGDQQSQTTDNIESFQSFHSFRSKIEGTDENGASEPNNVDVWPSGVARTSSYVGSPERPETPEIEVKTLARSIPILFPVEDREPERPETGGQACARPILDLNHAAPQRSDWWTGPLMAEVDRAAAPPSDATLLIPPEKVRAGVERELRALADLGRDGAAALRDAIAITRAKIRNSEALAGRQVHDGRCHVCGEPLDDTLPVVSVLTGRPGAHLHLHSTCHAEHIRRMATLIDRIMTAAGFGADRQGEAT